MGIRFLCPNGHKLNVKAFLAGERGICPQCDAIFLVPSESGGQVAAISEPMDLPQAPQAGSEAVAATSSIPVAEGNAPLNVEPPPPPAPSSPAVAAPPAEAPAEVWYVRTADGQQYGPSSTEVMQTWVTEGRVTVDCWVWRTGWPDWKPGGQAITLLNVVPGTAAPNIAPASAPSTETNPPQAIASEPARENPAPESLPEPTNPTAMYQTTKRLRQERARKITLLLGVVVVVLFAVLIVVLINNQ